MSDVLFLSRLSASATSLTLPGMNSTRDIFQLASEHPRLGPRLSWDPLGSLWVHLLRHEGLAAQMCPEYELVAA
eukprot:COSAG02_NODE_53363_length_302_cov_0.827586_1_plen_73_part_01